MLPSSGCLDLGALHVGSSGMPSMCVGQTIGRLCQPAPGVLGGLGTGNDTLASMCKHARSLLSVVRLVLGHGEGSVFPPEHRLPELLLQPGQLLELFG